MVGDVVGDDVAVLLDVGDCVAVGDPDGLDDGDPEGLDDGEADGLDDGEPVGVTDGSGVGVPEGCTSSRTSWNSTVAAYWVVTVTRVSLPSGSSMTPLSARARARGAVHSPRSTTLMLVWGLELTRQGRE